LRLLIFMPPYLQTPLFGIIPVVTLFVVCAGAVIITVTVTTVTCSAPPKIRPTPHSRVHSVPGVSSMKQKTLQFALEWCSRTQDFQVGRQPIPSTECGNRESPVTIIVPAVVAMLLERRNGREQQLSVSSVVIKLWRHPHRPWCWLPTHSQFQVSHRPPGLAMWIPTIVILKLYS